ncbi:MAG: diphosphomevalonate decarboxylase [Flavobacteriales bacterium]|nr:diphosphomevalonate decarboxylase [Flavobacteriales bacterium]
MTNNYIYTESPENLPEGTVSWESPSNIALVKYWGKKREQLPANPSISFTLNNCKTTTTLTYSNSDKLSFEVYVDGKREEGFEPKIKTFFERISEYASFINTYKFRIDTSNSFPHSSGIASSASGLSALALCICSIEQNINLEFKGAIFLNKASFLARLGSGSACRSLFPKMASWGKHEEFSNSSDFVGTPYSDTHSIFSTYQDTILLVDKGQKQVSSTVGHGLMHNHPFAKARFDQANSNLSKLKEVLKSGDLKEFNKIVESEALTLHAMMMSSDPYFLLVRPNTIAIIEKVWAFRKEHQLNLTVTLDAGSNVHLLYPEAEKEAVLEFIKSELVVFCENGAYICDNVGLGPKQLSL